MGTQQLLLIVVAVITVGVAIGLANSLFQAQSEDSTKVRIANELIHLSATAQQYYAKPPEMGGGGKSYLNWIIPAALDTTINGTYNIASSTDTELVILGNPIATTNYDWHIKTVVTQNNITTEIIN